MEKGYNPRKTESIEINKISPFFKSISIFLILIFAIVPLVEIVSYLEYRNITSYPTYHCFYSLDPIEILSFKKGT
tara:strand:+ start:318 stop:542 length:225 start_codon:yes stop_codon:yes gene_type:complete